MNSSDIALPAVTLKRKGKAHNSSESSEGSPTVKPVLKRRSAMEPLTKNDLMDLRSALKKDLKEEFASHLQPLVMKVSKLESAFEVVQQNIRANNVIIHGIQPTPTESTDSLMQTISELMKDLGAGEGVLINDIYRLGRKGQSTQQPLLVKFLRNIDKKKLMEKKKLLSAKKIFLNDDLTPLEQFNKKLLTTHLKAMKSRDNSIWGSIRRNSLHIKKDGYVTHRFRVENGVVEETPTRMTP
jgi:hypothetical protein